MINRTKVKESTQIKPGDNGDILVMKDNAPEWSTPSDADLAKASDTDAKLAEKQDKLTAGDNIHIVGNTISADGKPTPIAIGTVTSGEVPMVSNSGTDTDVILNFVLPKGEKGDKGDQGLQGPQGPVGAPFQVKKIYDSVEAMNADYSGSDVAIGEFVLIDTGDVQDPDNSKLYVKGATQYDFVTDLSGAQGIQGPQGNPGADAGFGNITATVDSTVGTPQVSVQSDGPNTAKNIAFNFSGLKGEKGDPGQAGTEVNNLAPLVVRTAPTAGDEDSIAIGDQANASAGGYVAIGSNARATGAVSGSYGSVAVGQSSSARDRGVAIGLVSRSDPFSVAIGYRADTGGNSQSVVIGHRSTAAASCYHPTAVGSDVEINDSNATALGYVASIGAGGENSVSLGSYSSTAEPNVVSVGSGVTTLTLSDDMTEEQQATARLAADVPTRRIINVTDPVNAQDAATKNYVDTQLTPINAKLQYVPENTNQILSQIETNVEKAQSAADAKVASITAGTGISVDASNPTAPVVSTTGLATQASVDALTSTVNSKANQTDIDSLEATVDAKVSSVTAGTGVSITGSATAPVVNGMIAVPDYDNAQYVPSASSEGDFTAPSNGVIYRVQMNDLHAGGQAMLSIKVSESSDQIVLSTATNSSDATGSVSVAGVFPVQKGTLAWVDRNNGQSDVSALFYFAPYKFVEIS